MTWLIEVDVDDITDGPLHGELIEVITTAIDAYTYPGYATRATITWRADD